MSRSTFTAVFAVATLATAAALATPSRAGETQGAPDTARYSDHDAVAPTTGDVADNALLSSTAVVSVPDADAFGPVAEHALAGVESDVAGLDDADAFPTPKSLSQLVNEYSSSDVPDAELGCLATAIYFESKSEPLAGQLAVAEVILNRTRSGRFPATVCGVVKQAGQFSFVHGGSLPAVPHSAAMWRTAVAIANIARNDLAEGSVPKALFFHARGVSPHWHLTRVASLGNHVFYR